MWESCNFDPARTACQIFLITSSVGTLEWVACLHMACDQNTGTEQVLSQLRAPNAAALSLSSHIAKVPEPC